MGWGKKYNFGGKTCKERRKHIFCTADGALTPGLGVLIPPATFKVPQDILADNFVCKWCFGGILFVSTEFVFNICITYLYNGSRFHLSYSVLQ